MMNASFCGNISQVTPSFSSTESMVSMCVLVSVWLYMSGGLPFTGKTLENICVEPVPFSLVLFYKFYNFPCLILVQWFETETFSKNISFHTQMDHKNIPCSKS